MPTSTKAHPFIQFKIDSAVTEEEESLSSSEDEGPAQVTKKLASSHISNV
jgi:hypothetical protein